MKIKLNHEDAKLPTRASIDSAGLDLYSVEDKFISKGSTTVVDTGISVLFSKGLVLKIEDRSGLAAKGLRTGAGVVDADYFPGTIKVVLHNLTNESSYHEGAVGYWVRKGDRIAQFLLYEVKMYEPSLWKEEYGLNNSGRNGKGFGSSGV